GRAPERGLAEWAAQTRRREARPRAGGLRFAFYGRVSTEDHQDPVTSRARQRGQADMLIAGHGRVVAEYFDAGQSRVPGSAKARRWSPKSAMISSRPPSAST